MTDLCWSYEVKVFCPGGGDVIIVCVCCRVWVRDISGATATIRYIDYGNEDVITRQDLRQLPDPCWQHQPLAVPCCVRSFSTDSPGESYESFNVGRVSE